MTNHNSDEDKFKLAVEAYAEVLGEVLDEERDHALARRMAMEQSAREYLSAFPYPPEAAVFGIPDDGIPIALNMRDVDITPVIVFGKNAADFLRGLAYSLVATHTPYQMEFGVISSKPEEWPNLGRHCINIFPSYSNECNKLIWTAAGWEAHPLHKQYFGIIIDDLSFAPKLDFDVKNALRYVMLKGPKNRIHVFAGLSPDKLQDCEYWLNARQFKTQVIGDCTQDDLNRFYSITGLRESFPIPQFGQFVTKADNQYIQFRVFDH